MFATQASLDDHYRGKPSHPNCPRCNKGFPDKSAVEVHFAIAHRKEKCDCGLEVYEEDLSGHFLHSPLHPVCPICTEGFKTQSDYSSHCKELHPEHYCEPCSMQLFSDEHQQAHWKESIVHPKCAKLCGIGFANIAAFNEHMIKEHGDVLRRVGWTSRSTDPQTALPHPSADTNKMWSSTKNHNSTMEWTSTQHPDSSGTPAALGKHGVDPRFSQATPRAHRDPAVSMPARAPSQVECAANGTIHRLPSTWSVESVANAARLHSHSTEAPSSSSSQSSTGWSRLSGGCDVTAGRRAPAQFECPHCLNLLVVATASVR
ncbi:hypothetical protein MIND_01210900 [Mycena indigotica]|uniref:C2H2-type domain-containing protein n=1 Tax=Mycena indigotica TaxID=2126181 RepID=A0A8H6VS09_9AGAR|nr:uncharacterized protein MIND_01210900 [Mycena indigotica]KAF7291857.1 hypothetical protein MIND_01210900 [Mycena indigotica]